MHSKTISGPHGRVPRVIRAQVMVLRGAGRRWGGGCHTRLFREVDEHPHYPAPQLIVLRQP